MIRVKLLTEKAYKAMNAVRCRCREYDESHFYELLRQKVDFTDQESLALLRHLHGEAAVAGKWYRRTTADGKPCIPAISQEAKYGLVVIENSRNGIYTPIEEAFSSFDVGERMDDCMNDDHDNPLVWTAFAGMDMDILLTYRIKDFDFVSEIPIEEEFILEDYLIDGVPTDIHVVEEYMRDPELRDGTWYISNNFYDQKYRWTQDLEEMLEVLRREFIGQPPLATGEFSLEGFEAMCWPEEAPNTSRLSHLRQEREEAEALGIPYEVHHKPWRVFNHMAYLPEEGEARRQMYLMIEEYPDGRFVLRDNISVKYPSYDELLWEAQELRKTDCEILILTVDVNEVMSQATDIRKAVCAFRVAEGIIETFGPEDGLREFERTLRRAVESDRYVLEVDV